MTQWSSRSLLWAAAFYDYKPTFPYGQVSASALDEEVEEEPLGWIDLPDMLLEDIFAMLTPRARHECSMVSSRWYSTFYSPRVWHTFVLRGRTLTKKIHNLSRGYVRELCPRKVQMCLNRVGRNFKRIIVPPMNDFYSLFEFLRVLSAFLRHYEEYPMPMLETFDFTFGCETRGLTGINVHGTGGKILEGLEFLIRSMHNLKYLKLNELLLETTEVPSFIAAISTNLTTTLRSLELVNCSNVPWPLPELSQFEQLTKLTISPQHLDDETIVLLASGGLCDLCIVQDRYTCPASPVSANAWKLVKDMSPYLKVTLEVRGNTREEILIQPHAPVHSIIYSSPHSKISGGMVMDCIYYYQRTLCCFKECNLPKAHGPRSFSKRCDSALMMLIRNCPRLHTLIVRERLSTATLLLMGKEGKSLQHLVVRQNALLKRSDWQKESHWSSDFYQWLKTTSRSFEATTEEVQKEFEAPWRPLRDEEFKQI